MVNQDLVKVLAQVDEAQRLIADLQRFSARDDDELWDRADDIKIVLDAAHTNLIDAMGLPKVRY